MAGNEASDIARILIQAGLRHGSDAASDFAVVAPGFPDEYPEWLEVGHVGACRACWLKGTDPGELVDWRNRAAPAPASVSQPSHDPVASIEADSSIKEQRRPWCAGLVVAPNQVACCQGRFLTTTSGRTAVGSEYPIADHHQLPHARLATHPSALRWCSPQLGGWSGHHEHKRAKGDAAHRGTGFHTAADRSCWGGRANDDRRRVVGLRRGSVLEKLVDTERLSDIAILLGELSCQLPGVRVKALDIPDPLAVMPTG